MALLSRTALRGDPVLNHNFVVQLLDSSGDAGPVSVAADLLNAVVGGFSECSGLEMTIKVEEFNEGGRNGEVLKFRGRVSWSNITLKKGLASGTVLWDWYYSFIQGRGARRDGVIILLNEQRLPNNIWQFRRGIPTKYTGPSLNATQNSVAIESMEIAHEGIFQVPGIGTGTEAVGSAANFIGVNMQVEINEVVSTVRAVDGDSLLAPQTLHRIVTAVIEALENVESHRERVRAETQVTGGVAKEQRGEGHS